MATIAEHKSTGHFLPALALLLVSTLLTLSACVVQDKDVKGSVMVDRSTDFAQTVNGSEVAAVAAEADKTLVDGWICGRDPRTFKSPYRTISAQEKAEFALAYRDFIASKHQALAQSRSTYIPYKERSAFARNYWENSKEGDEFKKQEERYQIAWVHESLLDGSELLFRAMERKLGAGLDSVVIMAHDVEQNMVSKYMEDERTERTFSDQLKPKDKSQK